MSAAFHPMPRAEARKVWAAEILGSLGIVAVLWIAGKVVDR